MISASWYPAIPALQGREDVNRIIVGVGIFGAGYHFKSWWGLVGMVPLLTAFVGFCPAYVPFGITTCSVKGNPTDQGRS